MHMSLTQQPQTCEEQLTCLGFNDDACGLQSSLTWCASPETVYYVMVSGYSSSDTGQFTLTYSTDISRPCLRRRDVEGIEQRHFAMPDRNEVVDIHPPMLSLEQRKAIRVSEKEAVEKVRREMKQKRKAQEAGLA